MKPISILTLYEIAEQTDIDYAKKYNHGWWGEYKSLMKSHDFELASYNVVKGDYNAKVDPLILMASRVKSGGHHKIGSFRTILVDKLYHAMDLGEPLTQEEIVLQWDRIKNTVCNHMLDIAKNEQWQKNFGLEYVSYEEAKDLYLHGWNENFAKNMGFVSLDHEKYGALLESCLEILGVTIDADGNDIEKYYENSKNSIEEQVKDQDKKARLLNIAEIAFKLSKKLVRYEYFKADSVYKNMLPKYNPFITRAGDARDYWEQNIKNIAIEPLQRPNGPGLN